MVFDLINFGIHSIRSLFHSIYERLNERSILMLLLILAGTTSAISIALHPNYADSEWWVGWFQNFSTELVGTSLTFVLFDLIIGVRNERRQLLLLLRSPDNSTALNALEQIKANGWHRNGTLQKADLHGANLQNALFPPSDLRGADITSANLQAAQLRAANLENVIMDYAKLENALLADSQIKFARLENANLTRANLMNANFQGTKMQNANLCEAILINATLSGVNLEQCNLRKAHLTNTIFDNQTVLPNANRIGYDKKGEPIYDKYWTPQTDMRRYTDPNHPDFWQPDWAKQQ